MVEAQELSMHPLHFFIAGIIVLLLLILITPLLYFIFGFALTNPKLMFALYALLAIPLLIFLARGHKSPHYLVQAIHTLTLIITILAVIVISLILGLAHLIGPFEGVH
jgi:hypothetical protein